MSKRDFGFSMLEVLVVVLILGIIAAMAIPQAYNAVKSYRLHSDAGAVAAQLNVTRFRATSQYAPYRLHIDSSTTPHSFFMERLCGRTPASVDANCTTPYQSYSTLRNESGTQYLSAGDSFTYTNPGGMSIYPGPITGGSASADFHFNTRGMPVDNSGNPVSNGGVVIYLKNQADLTDAVTISVGGRVAIYNWNPSTSAWVAR